VSDGEPQPSRQGAQASGAADGLSLPPPPAQRRGGIVRRSLAVAREHWWTAGAAAAVLLMPMSFVSAFVDRAWFDSRFVADAMLDGGSGPRGNPLLGFVEAVIVTPWSLAAALLVVIGRVAAVEGAVAVALRRLPQAVGAMFLAAVVAALPLLPAAALFVLNVDEAVAVMGPGGTVNPEEFPAGMVLAMLLLVLGLVPTVFLGLTLGLAVPLAVADGLGPVAACKASWRRMPGQRLRLLGGMLAVVLPALFVLSLLALPLGLLALSLGREGGWVAAGVGDGMLMSAVTVLLVSIYAVLRADTAPAEPLPPGDPEARWEPDPS